MKKIIHIFLTIISAFTFITLANQYCLADDESCNGFGETCHIQGISIVPDNPTVNSGLLDSAVKTIKWILGILATVAFIIILYAGFKVLTSGGDSKGYDAGMKIIKNAAIGLGIIGLARLIVSFVYRFVELMM